MIGGKFHRSWIEEFPVDEITRQDAYFVEKERKAFEAKHHS
jgi:hypothetical protein